MNLDQILQDAEEYAKIRDAATKGEWKATRIEHTEFEHVDDKLPEIGKQHPPCFCDLLGYNVDPLSLLDMESGWGLAGKEDAAFIAAAKNYDCVSVIKQLVERIKELESSCGQK